jgi:hypothetical protein
MRAHAFLHHHFSPLAGESPVGHAAAIVVGLTLALIGAMLIASVVVIPVGIVFVVLGLMLLGVGVFAHIASPFKLNDLLDTIVGLTGAAIATTFSLMVAAIAAGLALTALYAIVQWLIG